MPIKRTILAQRFDIEMINRKKCILSVTEGGQIYTMPIIGQKAIARLTASINDTDTDKAHDIRLELVRKVLLFNDFYFDEVELI